MTAVCPLLRTFSGSSNQQVYRHLIGYFSLQGMLGHVVPQWDTFLHPSSLVRLGFHTKSGMSIGQAPCSPAQPHVFISILEVGNSQSMDLDRCCFIRWSLTIDLYPLGLAFLLQLLSLSTVPSWMMSSGCSYLCYWSPSPCRHVNPQPLIRGCWSHIGGTTLAPWLRAFSGYFHSQWCDRLS